MNRARDLPHVSRQSRMVDKQIFSQAVSRLRWQFDRIGPVFMKSLVWGDSTKAAVITRAAFVFEDEVIDYPLTDLVSVANRLGASGCIRTARVADALTSRWIPIATRVPAGLLLDSIRITQWEISAPCINTCRAYELPQSLPSSIPDGDNVRATINIRKIRCVGLQPCTIACHIGGCSLRH